MAPAMLSAEAIFGVHHGRLEDHAPTRRHREFYRPLQVSLCAHDEHNVRLCQIWHTQAALRDVHGASARCTARHPSSIRSVLSGFGSAEGVSSYERLAILVPSNGVAATQRGVRLNSLNLTFGISSSCSGLTRYATSATSSPQPFLAGVCRSARLSPGAKHAIRR